MNTVCLSLVTFQFFLSSWAAPISPAKGGTNSTTIEEELHTLINSKSAARNETRSKANEVLTQKKIPLKEIIDALPNLHKELPDQLLFTKDAERSAAELVKRNLPKVAKQKDIMKNLYKDISAEDVNEYERAADEWSLDTPEDTSRDMAEYIFWTGDEVSVTQAVKDFMKQGLLSQAEAIGFLEDVRNHLKKMQIRYGVSDNVSREELKQIPDYSEEDAMKVSQRTEFKEIQEVAGSQLIPTSGLDEDFEHSNLRDMLYEMGKIFFKQSIVKDGPRDTEEALHNLATYLDAESDMGRISAATKTQILEVLFASLVDAMNDNPETDHKLKSPGRQE